jgi:hypothetical protein
MRDSDDFEIAHDNIDRFLIRLELLEREAFDVLLDSGDRVENVLDAQPQLSRRQAPPRRGSDRGAALQRGGGNELDLSSDPLSRLALKSDEVEQPDRLGELDEHVDSAVLARFVPRDRAEHRHARRAERVQQRLRMPRPARTEAAVQ